MAFCLIPKILNSVYVVVIFTKRALRALIDAKVTNIKDIITTISNSFAALAVIPATNISISLY